MIIQARYVTVFCYDVIGYSSSDVTSDTVEKCEKHS